MTLPPTTPAQLLVRAAREDRTPERSAPERADGAWDEELDQDGAPRPGWGELSAGLARMGPEDLTRLTSRTTRLLDDDGVSYHPLPSRTAAPVPGGPGAGEAAAGQATRWHLDPLPLVVDAPTWAGLEAGVQQRSRLMDALLSDVYGAQSVLTRGLVDPALVLGHDGYLREAHGIRVPGAHQLVLHAVDVVRGPDGGFLAVDDRTQAPSGTGYAMADRRAVARALPGEFARTGPQGLLGFFRALRGALEALAPPGVDEPRVVVLTPGAHSETAFDQASVASLLGLPLVGSADLTVVEGRLWMRALGGLEPVDVVLRRVDAAWSDPLDLRAGSRLGVAGLREVARRGRVSVVNTFGAGVLENPALTAHLPELSRALLDEDLLLPGVGTWWCGDPRRLSHALAHLDELVLRPALREPAPGDPGAAGVVGAELDAAGRERWRDRLRAEPEQWVAQELPVASVAPVATPSGAARRPVGMRVFSVAQQSGYLVMPGALGRVAADAGSAPTAKDVWVLAGGAVRPQQPPRGPATAALGARAPLGPPPLGRDPVTSPRALEDLFWLGRYAERTESLARLLMAARTRAVDLRLRPDAEGAGSLPVLVDAVRRVCGTPTAPGPGGAGPGVEDPAGTAPRTAGLEDRGPDGTGPWAAVPGVAQPRAVGPAAGAGDDLMDELRALTLDGTRPGTVAWALRRTQHAANAVRDQLSGDTWRVLAAAERALAAAQDPSDDGAELAGAHAAVVTAMLALSGLAQESMIRDTGWHVMDLGRRVERGQLLVSLLRAALTREHPEDVQVLVAESVLAVTESIVTHRRRYAGRTRTATVCELLLLDAGNPRSLSHQLTAAAADLAALPHASGATLPERRLAQVSTVLRRSVPADLTRVDEDGMRHGLDDLLAEVDTGLRALADAVALQHAWHQPAMVSLEEERAVDGPGPDPSGTGARAARGQDTGGQDTAGGCTAGVGA